MASEKVFAMGQLWKFNMVVAMAFARVLEMDQMLKCGRGCESSGMVPMMDQICDSSCKIIWQKMFL